MRFATIAIWVRSTTWPGRQQSIAGHGNRCVADTGLIDRQWRRPLLCGLYERLLHAAATDGIGAEHGSPRRPAERRRRARAQRRVALPSGQFCRTQTPLAVTAVFSNRFGVLSDLRKNAEGDFVADWEDSASSVRFCVDISCAQKKQRLPSVFSISLSGVQTGIPSGPSGVIPTLGG